MNPLAQFKRAALIAAQQNKDPVTWVSDALDFIPEGYYEMIYNMANSPVWYQTIFGTDPQAATFRPWIEKMRQAVIDELSEPPEAPEGPAPGPDGGDAGGGAPAPRSEEQRLNSSHT